MATLRASPRTLTGKQATLLASRRERHSIYDVWIYDSDAESDVGACFGLTPCMNARRLNNEIVWILTLPVVGGLKPFLDSRCLILIQNPKSKI